MACFDLTMTIPPKRGNLLSALADKLNTSTVFINKEDVERFKRFFFWADLTENNVLFFCNHINEEPKRKKKRIRDNYLGDYTIYLGLRYYEATDAYLVFFLRSDNPKIFYMYDPIKAIKDYKVLLEFE